MWFTVARPCANDDGERWDGPGVSESFSLKLWLSPSTAHPTLGKRSFCTRLLGLQYLVENAECVASDNLRYVSFGQTLGT
jgi:hypothetical protein